MVAKKVPVKKALAKAKPRQQSANAAQSAKPKPPVKKAGPTAPAGSVSNPIQAQRSINAAQAPRPSVQPVPTAPAPRRTTQSRTVTNQAMVGPTPASMTPTNPVVQGADLAATVQELYGDYMMHFLQHPEIGPIIQQAASNGYSADRLRGMLSATKWWKDTSNSARLWEQQMAEDPASANQQIDQVSASISDQASVLGLELSPAQIRTISEDSLKFGWDSTQIVDRLASMAMDGTSGAGTIDVLVSQIKGMAKNYMLPLDDATAFNWAMRVTKGEMVLETVKVLLGEQAKSRYPALAGIIDSGGTPADFFAPYRSLAAQTLEIPIESIDFTQGKWASALQSPGDITQPMMLTDFERLIKRDDRFGYRYTNQANDQADSLAMFIGEKFGQTTA